MTSARRSSDGGIDCPGCPASAVTREGSGAGGQRHFGVLLVSEAEPAERDGVASPLAGHVERQRAALAANLGRRKLDVSVALGWIETPADSAQAAACPSIGDALAELIADGATDVLAILLAPQFSEESVCRVCREVGGLRLSADRNPPSIDVEVVRDWHAEPRLLGALASAAYEALDAIWAAGSSVRPGVDWALGNKTDAPVIFVAPERPGLPAGDPYPELVGQTASLVADRLGLPTWAVAFVGRGRSSANGQAHEEAAAGVPVEPDSGSPAGAIDGLEAVARRLGARGFDRAAVCPIGWTADALDILVDLDGQAASIARTVGIELERARSMNDDPVFVAALADIVQRHVERAHLGGAARS